MRNTKYLDVSGFPIDCHWYKGNLHSHTINSDGKLTPEQAVRKYHEHGYQFLCLSEHDLYTDYRSQLNQDDFIILPGLEASSSLLHSEDDRTCIKTHHMHGILGTQQMQDNASYHFAHNEILTAAIHYGCWDGFAAAQKLVDTLHKHGCLVTYNHPIWSRIEPQEIVNLKGVWGIEIYNYNTVNESGTGADTAYWDLMLRSGHQIYGFASDDNHNQGKFPDSFGGWVQVAASALNHDSIVSALLMGKFYSSSGPEIYGWGVKDDFVWIDCSPCQRINFICGGPVNAGTTIMAASEKKLDHGGMLLTGRETYVRIECVDQNGKTAWTNAIFLQNA